MKPFILMVAVLLGSLVLPSTADARGPVRFFIGNNIRLAQLRRDEILFRRLLRELEFERALRSRSRFSRFDDFDDFDRFGRFRSYRSCY